MELEENQIIAKPEKLTVNGYNYNWDYIEWVQQYDEKEKDDELEVLRQQIKLLTLEKAWKPETPIKGATIKYFDNNGEGWQPTRAYESDASLDLFYTGDKPLVVEAGKVTSIDTKVAFEIPPETFVKIKSHLSMARKGINIIGGVCDAGYTGNIIV